MINVSTHIYKDTVASQKFRWRIKPMQVYSGQEMLEILNRAVEKYELLDFTAERKIVKPPGETPWVSVICTARIARLLMKSLRMIKEMAPYGDPIEPKKRKDGTTEEEREPNEG